jgi:hypothetical protein
VSDKKFSPGPWSARIGTDGVANVNRLSTEIVDASGNIVARTDSQSLSGRSRYTSAVQECNAALIAAAPDLYAALEAVIVAQNRDGELVCLACMSVSYPDDRDNHHPECFAARALAAARGEQVRQEATS